MGRRWRFLALAGVAAVLMAVAAGGQPAPATRAVEEELPANVLALLGTIEDFTYDFDHPAYYALLEFVRGSSQPPGSVSPPPEVNDWRELIERPADFRGLAITIEGVVGRNKDPYTHPRHPELGQVWQVELSRPDQAATCTVIFTSDASDLPLGATIRLTGYFAKVNRYPTQSAREGLAALLVAPGPSSVSVPAPPTAADGLDWRWMTVAIVAALVVTFLLLRRARRRTPPDLHELRARRAAPLNLADDLADWAERERPDETRADEEKPRDH